MNALYIPNELQVGIDIGSLKHSVAIGDGNGGFINEFEITHTQKGFDTFFKIVDTEARKRGATVTIAMEGYNGWARPFDQQILQKAYKLYNVNNVKLARFKEIFPGAAKTDSIDARKIVELFTLQKHLPVAKKVLQEINASDSTNIKLKKLTRRRKQLVNERMAIANRFSADLQAEAPELKALSSSVDNLWFLRFMTLKKDIRQLARVHKKSIMKIDRLGPKRIAPILEWQKEASFSSSLDYTASILYEDAMRLLELKDKIKALDHQIDALIPSSQMARVIKTIPGFSTISAATLAGEIDTLDRFKNEGSLALYLGMTNLDNSSGKYKGSKRNMATNKSAKSAMVTATMKHSQHVLESKLYIEKKISKGKNYQQAIRSLGRHMVRVIWSMIQQDRDYELRENS